MALQKILTDGSETGSTAAGKINTAINEIDANTLKRTYPSTDETKLSGIEAGATADQSDAEIKTAYENNADTNAYTDSEKTKLGGVEASANNYVHPTGDGNLHVPSNGTLNNGKVLTASAVAGTYTWETSASGVTDHTLLSNIGTNTHVQIDTHIADATKHRIINDAGTLTTELFSASKIISDLSGKSDTSHDHTGVYAPALGVDDNYVTDAEKVVIGNTSGTNTGDQDISAFITAISTETLTNKTLDSFTNTVHADATHIRVRALENIAAGQAVKYSGYHIADEAIEIVLGDQTTAVSIGIAKEDIGIGTYGLIISNGILSGINTLAYTAGDILYLSTAGGLTTTEPTTGISQPIAFVLKEAGAGLGALLINADYPKQRADDIQYNGTTTVTEAIDGKEAADATILKDADIGVNIQAYNLNYVIDASYVHTDNNFTTVLKTNYDTAFGWGNHASAGYLTAETSHATVAETDSVNVFSVAQKGSVGTITYAASVALDMNAYNNFAIALTGNITLANPTNITANQMQGGIIQLTQDVTGGRTLTLGANWVLIGTDDAVTTTNKVNLYQYTVIDATTILIQFLKDI